MARRIVPTLAEEIALAHRGVGLVAGVDEVGRGPLAGPVVAGAVILASDHDSKYIVSPPNRWLSQVRDSKALTPSRREALSPRIQEGALAAATGMASSQEIDEVGIVEATRRAMLRAVRALPVTPQFLLLDGRPLDMDGLPCKAIVRGDATCLSIAAASIVAKVWRDALMVRQDAVYPGYDFARHKGYPTPNHLRALRRLGPCDLHRRSFAPVRELLEGNRV